MPDVQEAAPSAAPVAEPSFEVPRSGPEYTEWRKTGNLPEKKIEPVKPADTAAADTSKETQSGADEAEDAPDTDRAKQQEEPRIPKSRLDKEIAKRRELETRLARLESERQTTTQAESSPATAKQQPPQTYAEWRKTFKSQEFNDAYIKQNPNASWEEMEDARADYLAEARDYFRNLEQTRQASYRSVEEKANEARSLYPDFDEVRVNFLNQIVDERGNGKNGFPQEFIDLMANSPNMAHLVYVVGSDPEEAAKFVNMARTNRYQAYRYLARVEEGIEAELSKGKASARNDKGQFTRSAEPEPAPAPAKRGPESAPEPPIEIGSRGSGPLDESERAFKDAERGSSKAFRAWKEAEDRKELARRRGA